MNWTFHELARRLTWCWRPIKVRALNKTQPNNFGKPIELQLQLNSCQVPVRRTASLIKIRVAFYGIFPVETSCSLDAIRKRETAARRRPQSEAGHQHDDDRQWKTSCFSSALIADERDRRWRQQRRCGGGGGSCRIGPYKRSRRWACNVSVCWSVSHCSFFSKLLHWARRWLAVESHVSTSFPPLRVRILLLDFCWRRHRTGSLGASVSVASKNRTLIRIPLTMAFWDDCEWSPLLDQSGGCIDQQPVTLFNHCLDQDDSPESYLSDWMWSVGLTWPMVDGQTGHPDGRSDPPHPASVTDDVVFTKSIHQFIEHHLMGDLPPQQTMQAAHVLPPAPSCTDAPQMALEWPVNNKKTRSTFGWFWVAPMSFAFICSADR